MALSLDWSHAPAGRIRGLSPHASEFAKRLKPLAGQLERNLSQGAVPFLDMPYRPCLESSLPGVLAEVKEYRHMILLGIGGSALGARALQRAFAPGQDRPVHKGPSLWIADNIDVVGLEAWMTSLDPAQCCVVVVSKSGGTIETLAQYFILRDWLKRGLGPDWKKHVVLVTDAQHGELREEAERENMLSLPVPDHLGGRYSVFSAVGMLPAAYLGIKWRELMEGASAQVEKLVTQAAGLAEKPELLSGHPAWRLAVWSVELMAHGYSQLIFFSYIPGWDFFGQWFSQLWAESLGKSGKGSMPLPAVGVTDQHSLQQMFLDGPKDKGCLFLTAKTAEGQDFPADIPEKWHWLKGRRLGDLLGAEALGTRMAMAKANIPLLHIHLDAADERHAGELMSLLMLTTLLTGWLMEINPLDQPAVELGKRLANARLGAPGLTTEKADLQNFLDGLRA